MTTRTWPQAARARAGRARMGVVLLTVALFAAGCGTRVLTPSAHATQVGHAVRTALGDSADPHRAIAERDAAAIVASFRPPPGARRSAGLPAGAGAFMAAPPEGGGIDVVDDSGWWVVPGSPKAVLAWVRRHPPAGSSYAGGGSAGRWNHMTYWWVGFSRPPVPAVLSSRELLVAVGAAAGGRTAVRVDAQVAWLPTKPATAHVPASARIVTAVAGSGEYVVTGRSVSRTPAAWPSQVFAPPVTVTRAAQVRRIAALVDRLPIMPPGMFSCPRDWGARVWLVFRARAGGPVLARAVADPDGCGDVALVVDGRLQQGLMGGQGLVRRIESMLGVRWPGLFQQLPGCPQGGVTPSPVPTVPSSAPAAAAGPTPSPSPSRAPGCP